MQVVRSALAKGWRIERAGTWTHVTSGVTPPEQGWKIHLSAVPLSAGHLLERAAPVLVAHGCPFKFAASPHELALLTGRLSGGNFLTVYPLDGVDLPGLAGALDEATAGLPGPRILSDRPYRPGSVVHFRFGGFVRKLRLTGGGVYEPVVTAPDGTHVTDLRDTWFEPPPWAPPSPFPHTGGPPEARDVLIGDRFRLRGAIRHANKGGVFRATDERTGEEAVVKQGRRYVETRPDGGDVRDLLVNEARMLGRLAATGLVPRVHALLELPEHTFLAIEAIDGVSLSVHLQRLHRGRSGRPDHGAVRGTATALVDLVAAVHREGVVVRDLTPANVMVLPDESLRLIDLELAAGADEDVIPAGSPGYAAPEQWTARRASTTADLYSLGAILFALATGAEPVLAVDERDTHERIAGWLARTARDNPTAAAFAPLILDLMAREPADRPGLDQVRTALREATVETRGAPPPGDGTAEADRLLDDGLAYLIASGGTRLNPAEAAHRAPGTERWWPADTFGATTDPCNAYLGGAGVLAVLAAARHHRHDFGSRGAIARAASWLDRYAAREPLVLPGLHFGRSGTYWALLEAGITLGDENLLGRTADAAERLPVSGPMPDVSHGIAGSGLTALRFWRHTRRESFLRQAGACADTLLETAVLGAEHIIWPVPPQPPHLPDGAAHYGFSHGIAGIAAFLLDAAAATGRADCLAAAHLAGRTLCAVALQGVDGTVRWSAGPGDHVPLTGWCSGAAGVGEFLLRLWLATGEPEFHAAAVGAAAAVRHDVWQARPIHCHGVAGSIEYLMDVAEVTGEERYAAWARESVSALVARAVVRDGLLLTPDHGGLEVNPGWGVGAAGVVAALLRLRGAPQRLFMPPLPGAALSLVAPVTLQTALR